MAYNEHYVKNCATVQVIDVIECCPFTLGSLLKYMTRYGSKDDVQQELSKIHDYLRRILDKDLYAEIEMVSWWSSNKKFVKLFADVFKAHGFDNLEYDGTLFDFLWSVQTALKEECFLYNGCQCS